ncbi:hypothetical protein GOP47_0000618 [Adiantum capillus-veneris]|uniref:Rubisco LSMT substrate-binding domain-containing protein n=1 Tax=Adiantum capillus-veneris TaxID=13818 RepID=A0A9D4VDN3_ADICA|nr:hypothetical protein GOP47_0000618 [Adiantum capillus-veneris]
MLQALGASSAGTYYCSINFGREPQACTGLGFGVHVGLSRTGQASRCRSTSVVCVSTLTANNGGKPQALKEEEQLDLMKWMYEQGLPPCKVELKDRSCHGFENRPIHYVVAKEDLQPGDVAFRVPNSLVVTLERILGNETIAELLTTNKLSELACLALYLMYEKKRGKESFWYPFIRELDRQRGRGQLAVESPLLWQAEELEYLAGSPMKEVVSARLEGIRREYKELDTVWFMAGSLFQQYPFDIPTEAFSFEIFKQAFVAVQSCVVHLQDVPLARRFALVPLGPPLLAYKSTCKAMLKSVGDAVQLQVDQAYKVGEAIVVWCGPQANVRLLLNYGFVDEDNPYDRLSIEVALDTSDPLYQAKRLVAQRNNRLAIQGFQIYKGKERETILDMLPFLRLGHVSEEEDMQSVLSSEGPVCGVSPCRERAVLDQLESYFTSRIAKYSTTLSEDVALLEDPSTLPKRRVATQLVKIEKEMLHSCLAIVREMMDALPNTTPVPCSGAYVPTLR